MKLRIRNILALWLLCLTLLTATLVGCRQKEDLTDDQSISLPPAASEPSSSDGNSLPPPENSEETIIPSPIENAGDKAPTFEQAPGAQSLPKEPQETHPSPTPPPVTEESRPDTGSCPDTESSYPSTPSAPSENPDTPSEAPSSPSEEEKDTVSSPSEDENDVPSSLHAYEQEVVRLVNEIRQQYGLPALKAKAKLSEVAREKSKDMRRNGYFDHVSPTYGSPFDMMKSFGISYRAAGENIAMGYPTPAAVVEGWMNSEGHRANILNSSFSEIGVGYVADGHYWTQMFIG